MVAASLTTRRHPPVIGAAVDVGAHSVHLLVAEIHGHLIVPLADESATLGLGATVDALGGLGPEATRNLVETLERYDELARLHGASTMVVAATDPLRRAADGEGFAADLKDRLGIDVQVLEPREEALLALLGAQTGRPIRRRTVLIDVGGGSSEIIAVGPSDGPVIVGLSLGAARLSRTIRAGDPPGTDDIEAMVREARSTLIHAPDFEPDDLVAVGGTASNLLRVGPPLVRRVLTTRRLREALRMMAVTSSEEISATYAVKPARALVLPGGAAILLAVAERYGRTRIRVSHDGLREGILLASAHGGPGWRADLDRLARGWTR